MPYTFKKTGRGYRVEREDAELEGGKKNVFLSNVEADAKTNNQFKRFVYTAPDKLLQVALMNIVPQGQVGSEIHPLTDQFIRVEDGNGIFSYEDNGKIIKEKIKKNDAFIIPAKTKHNVINTSKNKNLKLFTIYNNTKH